ncbi:outer membrane protein assembly factor BamB family protein [Halosimplex sp. J119]
MVSRRRFLHGAAASTALIGGCLGRAAEPTQTASESAPTTSAEQTATPPAQPTANSERTDGGEAGGPNPGQFQYDAANTGVVDTAAPASANRRWRTRIDPAEGGLALSGDTLVVAARSLVGLDAADGSERWRADVGHDLAAPPTTTDDTAYVAVWNGGSGADRGVVAVDLADGSERWRAVPDVDVNSPLTLAEGVLFAGGALNQDAVIAIDAADGEELWRFTAGEYATTAAVADGVAFVGGGQTHAVYALDADSGEELWRFDATDEVWAAPTVRNGTVYVGARDGRAWALDPANGDKRWHADAGSTIRHSVAATEDAVYVPTEKSLVALSTDGDELWSTSLGHDGHALTVTESGVVCTDRQQLYCFDAADGADRWVHTVRDRQAGDAIYGGIRSPPLVADGTVYTVSFAGDVYALAAESTSKE